MFLFSICKGHNKRVSLCRDFCLYFTNKRPIAIKNFTGCLVGEGVLETDIIDITQYSLFGFISYRRGRIYTRTREREGI